MTHLEQHLKVPKEMVASGCSILPRTVEHPVGREADTSIVQIQLTAPLAAEAEAALAGTGMR